MNVMCDTNKFAVVVSIPDGTSAILVSNFIQHVIMKYDFCYLVVQDNSALCTKHFINIYHDLNLNDEFS